MLGPMTRDTKIADTTLRHDWSTEEVERLFDLSFPDLIYEAQTNHRRNFPPNQIQMSTLLSIKTGGCSEDCSYCSQSAKHDTDLEPERLMTIEDVIARARSAKEAGATRYCMGAAWRSPAGRSFERVLDMVRAVKDLGMETCVTLGMLDEEQVSALKDAGLDYYNHNIDTSPDYYKEVVTTHTIDDRLRTLQAIRAAELKVCAGGIVGMGESRADRVEMLRTLANLPSHPDSVPINMLVPIPGTPFAGVQKLDTFEFVRTIAVARVLMPRSFVRLSAGREEMSDEAQALCFLAGANSIFTGASLLTTPNPEPGSDADLFARLGLEPMP